MKDFEPAILAPDAVERRVVFVVGTAGVAIVEDGSVEGEHYLGVLRGVHAYVSEGEHPSAASLRSLYGKIDDATFAVAGRAAHVIDWASTSRFCGRCGAANQKVAHERAMKCPRCGLIAYPRIAPAVIVLIQRGEQALLARGTSFPSGFYSTLAGFSEIGESLEETLAREVREEVGIEIANVRYFASQPWPFPHSLMIGFFADYARGEIRVDPAEIVDAKWFRKDELPPLPARLSIARRMIDAWIAAPRLESS